MIFTRLAAAAIIVKAGQVGCFEAAWRQVSNRKLLLQLGCSIHTYIYAWQKENKNGIQIRLVDTFILKKENCIRKEGREETRQ